MDRVVIGEEDPHRVVLKIDETFFISGIIK